MILDQTEQRMKKKDLKKDVKMFAQLCIATQVRGGDMERII